jgi:hypothetical protein
MQLFAIEMGYEIEGNDKSVLENDKVEGQGSTIIPDSLKHRIQHSTIVNQTLDDSVLYDSLSDFQPRIEVVVNYSGSKIKQANLIRSFCRELPQMNSEPIKWF